jgi:hypothetical protein
MVILTRRPVSAPAAALYRHRFGKPEFKKLNRCRRKFQGDLQKLIVFNVFFY